MGPPNPPSFLSHPDLVPLPGSQASQHLPALNPLSSSPHTLPAPGLGVSPAGTRRGCADSGLSPRSGPPPGQTVSSQGPPAPGLRAAHGSPRAAERGGRLSPPPNTATLAVGLGAGGEGGGGLPGQLVFGAEVADSPLATPTDLAAMVVEDEPVGRAQERVSVSPSLQGLHGECLPQDHVVPHSVCVLAGKPDGEAQGLRGQPRAQDCPLAVGWGGGVTRGFPPPAAASSWGPHHAAAVATGLQRAVGGHKDGVGCGGLNLGHQLVMLRARGRGHRWASLPSGWSLEPAVSLQAWSHAPKEDTPPLSSVAYLQQLPEEAEGGHQIQLLQHPRHRQHVPPRRQ